jgi:hypothetical protein
VLSWIPIAYVTLLASAFDVEGVQVNEPPFAKAVFFVSKCSLVLEGCRGGYKKVLLSLCK